MSGARVSAVIEEFTRLLRPQGSGGVPAPDEGASVRLLIGAVLCLAAYGAVAGLFQGGLQVGLSALKVPMIVLGTAALCLPSLYVFASLAGARLSARQFCCVVAAFLALLGLLAVGLIPVNWLFSVSSRSLMFVVWLHTVTWLLVVSLARRYLRAVFPEEGPRQALGLWLVLFVIVSFQVATCLRPVLWRDAGDPAFERGRLFFMEQLDRISNR